MTSLMIGWDLDGVMFDYVDNTRKGAMELWPDWRERGYRFDAPSTTWNYFSEDWGLSPQQFRYLNQWMMEQGILFEGPIEDGWVDVMNALISEGHTIHIVTHRSIPGSVEATGHWLRQHNVPYDSLSFVQNIADKALLELDVLIDDKVENIENWTSAGRHAVIYHQAWNQHYQGRGIRCYNPRHVAAAVRTIAQWKDEAKEEAERPETILQEAQRLVHGDRGVDYGHPIEDFTRTGRIWGAVLGLDRDVTPNEVALCMVGVKMSRETHSPKRDNRVDGAGYMETLDMVVQKQQERGS